MLSDVTDVWQYDCDITLTLILNLRKKETEKEKEKGIQIKKLESKLYMSDNHTIITRWTCCNYTLNIIVLVFSTTF